LICRLRSLWKGYVTIMSNIAVIGDNESILGFKALGFDVYHAVDFDTGRKILHQLAQSNTAIILVVEDLAFVLQEDIKHYESQISPAIILIPGVTGSLGISLEQITTRVKKAVGMDILKERNEVPT